MIPIRSLLIAFLLSIPVLSFGQDTLYLTMNGKACVKTDAQYYSVKWPQPGGRYKVEEHYMDGMLKKRGTYPSAIIDDPNLRDGYFTYWDKEGHKTDEGAFEMGKHAGVWKFYYKNGIVKREELYKDGVISERHLYDSTGKQKPYKPQVYQIGDQMPEPSVDMVKYLQDNLRYPEKARKNNIEGRVIVKFLVNEDGTLSNISVLKGVGSGCDEEAVRVIAAMPPWKPAKKNGDLVKVHFVQPITFVLMNR